MAGRDVTSRFWGAAWSQVPLRGRDAEGEGGALKMGSWETGREEIPSLTAEFSALGLGSEGWQPEPAVVAEHGCASPAPALLGHLEEIPPTASPVPQFPPPVKQR